jgi:LuxR family quorum sensing-dependent transcriptional regulator
MDIYRFINGLAKLRTPAACAALFKDVIAEHDFDTFACGLVDPTDRERNVFYMIDWPERWQRFYMQSGLLERDPVVDALARYFEPFTWSDLKRDRTLSKAGRAALDMVAAEGWTEGLVTPFHMGPRQIGIVSLVGHTVMIDPAAVDFLKLCCVCLFNHVRTLVAQNGFAMPPLGLTPREIECVRLVARGRSDADIARELGIAVSTAHEFVEKAKRRFKTRSRAEMAAAAVALGVIDI